jgi:hypothetical protein
VEKVRRDEYPPLVALENNLRPAAYSLTPGHIAAKHLEYGTAGHLLSNYIYLEPDSTCPGRRRASGEERGQSRLDLRVHVCRSAAAAMPISYSERVHVWVIEDAFADIGYLAAFAGHKLADYVHFFILATRYRNVCDIGLQGPWFVGRAAQYARSSRWRRARWGDASHNGIGDPISFKFSGIVHAPDLERGMQRCVLLLDGMG